MKLINPLEFQRNDFPLIVFADNSISFISWIIRWMTNGVYNHVMAQITEKSFHSQNFNGFKIMDIKDFIHRNRNCKLKYYQLVMTDSERFEFMDRVQKRVNKPSGYDFLGVLGQLFYGIIKFEPFKKLNNPWKTYCSEQVNIDLKEFLISLDIPMILPVKPSPEELEQVLRTASKMQNPKVLFRGYHIGG